MNKKNVLLAFCVILCDLIVAQTLFGNRPVPMAPVLSINPSTLSQGRSFTANAQGYNSFFYNPAGFAVKTEKEAITALSISSWVLGDPQFWTMLSNPQKYITDITGILNTFKNELTTMADGLKAQDFAAVANSLQAIGNMQAVYDSVTNYLKDNGVTTTDLPSYGDPQFAAKIAQWIIDNPTENANIIDILEKPDKVEQLVKVAAESFFRGGALEQVFNRVPTNAQAGLAVGFGYVNNGLGTGLLVNFDLTFVKGGSLAAMLSPTIMANAGYAFSLFDDTLLLGFNVRPMVKFGYLQFNVTESTVIQMLNNPARARDYFPVYSGFGIGLDFGAIYKLPHNFQIGLALKDAPTFFQMYAADTKNLSLDAFFYKKVDALFYVPPNLAVGVSWSARINRDFKITASAQIDEWIPQLVYKEYYGTEFDWFSLFKIGVSAQLFNFMHLNAGYGAGFISTGLGLKFLVFDINVAAAYRPPLGIDRSLFGLALEFALRF